MQEWIAKNPTCICSGENEKLLIIQKEFDGFNDTSERLDLLAIDQTGALVVIENKLDDTGRDVTWQALKYVSYCSTLKPQQIKDIYQSYLDKTSTVENAEDNIVEFFNGKAFDEIRLNEPDQRMILVAGKFRKEITSTVMWMIGHNLNVQCFKAVPYKWQDKIFLDIEQIIPVKEAEDYMIKIADKNRELDLNKELAKGIEELRKSFWIQLLEKYNLIDSSFKNVNPTNDSWISCGSGVTGCPFSFIVTKTYAAIELSINNGEKERNKEIFDNLKANRVIIENSFGNEFVWDRLDKRISSHISYKLFDVNIANKEDWDQIIDFLCTHMPKMIISLKAPLRKAMRK